MEETGELNFFISSIFTDIAYFRTVPIATLSAEKGREKRSPIASNALCLASPPSSFCILYSVFGTYSAP